MQICRESKVIRKNSGSGRDDDDYDDDQGKNYMRAPGDFAPEMQKRALEKKKKILKIAIDCNVKPVQCCRFSQWDVKSSPRK